MCLYYLLLGKHDYEIKRRLGIDRYREIVELTLYVKLLVFPLLILCIIFSTLTLFRSNFNIMEGVY